MKDERALEDYLLDLALAGAQVPPAARQRLSLPRRCGSCSTDASQYKRVLERIAQRRARRARHRCRRSAKASRRRGDLARRGRAARARRRRRCEARLEIRAGGEAMPSWHVEPDPEHGGQPRSWPRRAAPASCYRTALDAQFLRSPTAQRLRELWQRDRKTSGGAAVPRRAQRRASPRRSPAPIRLLDRLLELGEARASRSSATRAWAR